MRTEKDGARLVSAAAETSEVGKEQREYILLKLIFGVEMPQMLGGATNPAATRTVVR